MNKLVILLSLVLVGCSYTPEQQAGQRMKEREERQAHLESVLRYFKDTRTNLCFVGISNNTYGSNNTYRSFTAIPCTPEVEALIK